MVYRQYEKQIGQSYIIELCIISGGVHYYLGGILDLKKNIYIWRHIGPWTETIQSILSSILIKLNYTNKKQKRNMTIENNHCKTGTSFLWSQQSNKSGASTDFDSLVLIVLIDHCHLKQIFYHCAPMHKHQIMRSNVVWSKSTDTQTFWNVLLC